jgi:hypothetical protein
MKKNFNDESKNLKEKDILYLSLNISRIPADKKSMNEIKRLMIAKAKERFKNIHPCGHRRKLDECFTIEDNKLCFWFNTEDDSTHVLHTRM